MVTWTGQLFIYLLIDSETNHDLLDHRHVRAHGKTCDGVVKTKIVKMKLNLDHQTEMWSVRSESHRNRIKNVGPKEKACTRAPRLFNKCCLCSLTSTNNNGHLRAFRWNFILFLPLRLNYTPAIFFLLEFCVQKL